MCLEFLSEQHRWNHWSAPSCFGFIATMSPWGQQLSAPQPFQNHRPEQGATDTQEKPQQAIHFLHGKPLASLWVTLFLWRNKDKAGCTLVLKTFVTFSPMQVFPVGASQNPGRPKTNNLLAMLICLWLYLQQPNYIVQDLYYPTHM